MKTLLLFCIMLKSHCCFSQQRDFSDSIRHIRNLNIQLKTARYSACYLAGLLEGRGDKLVHDYPAVKRVHPNMNDQFSDPSISWRNKWRDGDPRLGEKYIGSSTVFVPLTDEWHLDKGLSHFFTIAGTIVITIGGKKSWKYYVKEIAIDYLLNRAGFYTSYNLLYRN